MTRVSCFCALLAVFALTACGGSNGGGGGGITPAAPLSMEQVSKVFNDYDTGDKAVTAEAGLDAAEEITIEKVDNGIQIDIDNNVTDDVDRTFVFHADGDFIKAAGEDYIIALGSHSVDVADATLNGESDLTGTVVYEAILALGGTQLGLEYSEFGVWKEEVEFTDTATSGAANDNWRNDLAFFTLDSSNATVFSTSSGEAEFTGNAIGLAYTDTEMLDIFGTATLTIANLSDTSTGVELVLDFNDFYAFTLSDISIVGETLGLNGVDPVLDDTNNTSGIAWNTAQFDGGSSNTLSGTFAGAQGAADPTELVGKFGFAKGTDGILGAFGMKGGVKVAP